MITTTDIKKFMDIRYELREISEKEATRLFRLARKAIDHGCSRKLVDSIREEAWELYGNAYPERLLDPFKSWKFAFMSMKGEVNYV